MWLPVAGLQRWVETSPGLLLSCEPHCQCHSGEFRFLLEEEAEKQGVLTSESSPAFVSADKELGRVFAFYLKTWHRSGGKSHNALMLENGVFHESVQLHSRWIVAVFLVWMAVVTIMQSKVSFLYAPPVQLDSLWSRSSPGFQFPR